MLTCQRHLTSLPDDLHYLNCASRAPLLRSVEAAAIAGLHTQRVPEAVVGEEYLRISEELRSRIGQLINAPADAVALIPSASYGVAIAANGVPLRRGQNVVLPGEEFPSDVYPWMARCAEAGAELRLVERPADSPHPGRVWHERLLEAIDSDTAAVNLSAVHWTDGLCFDLAAIGARAREVGALFIVDGSQAIGAAPFDFQSVRADLVVCVGYKWLMGPYQLGFAAVGERLLGAQPFEQHWGNRVGSQAVGSAGYSSKYRPGARRFDVGEHANPITMPMLSEGVRQVLEWGVESIQAYCAELARRLLPLTAEGRVRALAPGERVEHILGLRLPEPEALPRIMEALRRRNIHASQRGTSLRVSPHVYNTPDDMDAFCEALGAELR